MVALITILNPIAAASIMISMITVTTHKAMKDIASKA